MGRPRVKGIAVDKLPVEKKEKLQRTLDRLTDAREGDSQMLRLKLEDKLKWLNTEHSKGLQLIKALDTQRKGEIDRLIKIEGAVEIITEILKIDSAGVSK